MKFKHPSKDEPIEVLMEMYSIGVYVQKISDKLKEIVKLYSKEKYDVFEIKYGNNLTNFKIDCDHDHIYTIMWMINQKELTDELANEVSQIVSGDENFKLFPVPGNVRARSEKRQGVIIYDKIPGVDGMIGLMTTLDIEQHPLMISLHREKRLGDILD